MESNQNTLTVSYLNIKGQTGFPTEKQFQIENLLKFSSSDILHLQETHIDDDTFEQCSFIKANYFVIPNNAANKYGTASLVKNDLHVENICTDTSGRIIIFEVCGVTFGNFYLPSGTDGATRAQRENYFGEKIPNMMVNSKPSGCIGGDFNCIISKEDATNNPETKHSPCLSRLVKAFNWSDSYRVLHHHTKAFSRYYVVNGISGASRIDRQYHWGEISILSAEYIPVAFSDHFGHIVKMKVPDPLSRLICPKSRPIFKVKEEVAFDREFQDRVKSSMEEWGNVDHSLPIFQWWELVIKPGIRKIAMDRSKQINIERRSRLNLLILRQTYLVKKIRASHQGDWSKWLAELSVIQFQINDWYKGSADKIKRQARVQEFQESEKTRIYHHEIHQRHIRKSAILKLQTTNELLIGHEKCAHHLESLVGDLLLSPANLCSSAQDTLLNELDEALTEEENDLLDKVPTKEEVLSVLKSANLNAAPGIDGITMLVYNNCWDSLGDTLTSLAIAMHNCEPLPASMRTSMMVFGSKPKKALSILPKDKRRISLLNCDFKLLEGIQAKRFRHLGNRLLSPLQYVAGRDRKIHHGIARSRDAISSAMKSKLGCGIADMDFIAAFDWLVLSWVWKVLDKLKVKGPTINRLQNLYSNSLSIVVVNNKLGRIFNDKRGSLRQGGLASMEWFAFGIDPLLRYLERRLEGIPIVSIPVQGPATHTEIWPLPALEERFKLMAYCDDVKPSISSMSEFFVVDKGCHLFEVSSGCKLHRDPSSGKCKFLALGRWRGLLEQEDIPLKYMVLTQTLDMVGVELQATWPKSRKVNGEFAQGKIDSTINSWKSGKFMDLISRPWSINNYALSKIWHRAHTVDLRVIDINKITCKIKSWLYQDQLEKPEEVVLYRSIHHGGLGLHNVKIRSNALLIKTFLETAINPDYINSLFHNLIYRFYILEDDTVVNPPPRPQFLSESMISHIKRVKENSSLNIATMSTSQWYKALLEDMLMEPDIHGQLDLIKTRVESASEEIDWGITWRRTRSRGLGSEVMSFLWKMINNILPTESRLARILPNSVEFCKFCPDQLSADLPHCLIKCVQTKEVGSWLVSVIRQQDDTVNENKLVKLDFICEENLEFPLVWLIGQTLHHLWENRVSGKVANMVMTRTMLEHKIALLRETRFSIACETLERIISNVN